MDKLLTRDQFRSAVFARDGHKCVICGASSDLAAHHIIERRLWSNGGYYLANGATLCPEHHLAAEATTLSCDEVRLAAGIESFPIPEHLYPEPIDKWGNSILPNGMRLRGELFDDESVHRVLTPVLALFTNRVKYPRTFHLPWSPSRTADDRVLASTDGLEGEVVVTVKMDGENTTFYRDGLHARSTEYEAHPSRSWVRALHARIANEIPEGWRICGENLYAKHAIHYQNLPAYFMVFSVWDEHNFCLNWEDTREWALLLGLPLVPALYRGAWNERVIRKLHEPTILGDECEGYVVRVARSFHYREFSRRVGKYVREGHVPPHGHWMRQSVVRNKLVGT